ncbi:hypothetical protein SRABI106_04185 [Rahnella aquatilis]|nr:hypothetical protein SRABI106_04185 [Rahnella aquatilis]
MQFIEEGRAFFLIQRQNDFTVRCGLEFILVAQFCAQSLMVVNFAVHSQNVGVCCVVQRLCAVVHVDNGQTLMRQNGFIAGKHTGPVGSAVTHQARQFQRFFAQLDSVSFDIEHTEN